jgi:hypothetical protein
MWFDVGEKERETAKMINDVLRGVLCLLFNVLAKFESSQLNVTIGINKSLPQSTTFLLRLALGTQVKR